MEGSFAFSFVEGVLVKAIREGKWVLLDEINLASAETLQRLSGLLEVSRLPSRFARNAYILHFDSFSEWFLLKRREFGFSGDPSL